MATEGAPSRNVCPECQKSLLDGGKVPVLIDEGASIYESTVVNEYLEDRFPNVRLMPRDPLGLARPAHWRETHFERESEDWKHNGRPLVAP
jgi:Glutathione S-transferase, N-terminal domain